MMKMWDIATSNQGGRGLASFVGTMKFVDNKSFEYFYRMHLIYVNALDTSSDNLLARGFH